MQIEKFKWFCGHKKISPTLPENNEICLSCSNKEYVLIFEAISDSLKHKHSNSVYIVSNKQGYLGLSCGLIFNL
jgi:hypothetical protein